MTGVEMVLIGSESQKVLHYSKLTVKEAGPRAEPWVPTEGGLSYSLGRDPATAKAAAGAVGSRGRRRLEVIRMQATNVLPGLERAWAEENPYGVREARRKH
jgi:hypothetical protein